MGSVMCAWIMSLGVGILVRVVMWSRGMSSLGVSDDYECERITSGVWGSVDSGGVFRAG